MLTIPPAIAELLKSKMMVGDNRPTGIVKLQSRTPGEPIDPFVDGTVVKWKLGLGSSHKGISAPIQIAGGGGYAFAGTYFDAGVYKVGIYFDADDGFFSGDYTFDSRLDTGIVFDAPDPFGIRGIVQTSLFRRSDGKVLLFVADSGTKELGTSVKVYISNSGDCTDFVYYSTILTVSPVSTDSGAKGLMNIPLELPSGRLVLTFLNGGRCDSSHIMARGYVCYSDDQGANWTAAWSWYGTFYSLEGIGQPSVTNDGRIYFETTLGTGAVQLWESTTDGTSFTEVTTYYQGIYGYPGYYPSLYYDSATDTMYRVTAGTYSGSWFWRMTNPTSERLLVWENWEQLASVYTNNTFATVQITKLPSGNIAVVLAQDASTVIFGISASTATVQPKAITIDRSKGSASQATIVLDNKSGVYSPDNAASEWLGVIWPNKEIRITMGYGDEQPIVFTGLIDEIQMNTYPAELTITARDKSKLALDQTITVTNEVGITSHTTMFINETPEYIFSYLAGIAGYNLESIFTEISGIVIEEITFSQESYADAFQRLAETAGFEWLCDENGNLFFRKAVEAEPVSGWTFSEGEDIFSLGYTISDAEVYRNIEVIAQDADGTTIYSDNVWPAADYYGLPINKTLIIQATDLASNLEQCAVLANQAAINLSSKPRQVEFVVVGNPYLQIGDCIRVIESTTTISEIYRVWSLTHEMSAEGDPIFSTSIKCYWYASG